LIRQQDSLQQDQSSFSKAVQRASHNRPEVGSFTFREQEAAQDNRPLNVKGIIADKSVERAKSLLDKSNNVSSTSIITKDSMISRLPSAYNDL
jgi:hypothetical protein